MILVVDTNRIIAALIKDSASRRIILSSRFNLITVNVLGREIEKHKEVIMEKAGISETQFKEILNTLFTKIEIIGDLPINGSMNEAKGIMDSIDPKDTVFIAAALATESSGIWSDDKHFKKQKRIRILTTEELLTL